MVWKNIEPTTWQAGASRPAALTAPDDGGLALQFDEIRAQLVDRLFLAAGVFAVINVPLMLWRAHDVGWYAHLYFHAFMIVLVLVLVALRQRLSVAFKSALLLCCFIALGLSGVLTNGMIGPGYWWCLQSAVVGAMLYSFRTGLVLALMGGVLMVFIGAGFVSGMLTVPYDLTDHLRSKSAWTGFLTVVTFAPTVLLLAFSGYQGMIRKLVAEIAAQRNELAARVGHDPLTGLPQATLAEDRLQVALHQASRNDARVALLFVDLDDFKAINDRHGHAAGDYLLQQVALRLRGLVRAHDTVARVGGDEFVVILGNMDDATAAGRVAHQIVEQVAAIAYWQGRPLQSGASVGVALYPDHGRSAAALRHSADLAMYAAKKTGRGAWRLAEHMADTESAVC